MGKIVSPAGDVSFLVKGVKRSETNMVIVGTMGYWDAEIYMSVGEMLKVFLNKSMPGIIVMLPIALVKAAFKGKKKEEAPKTES
jgi:hypothetical protein